VNKLCLRSISGRKCQDDEAFLHARLAEEALLEIGLAAVDREEEGRLLLERVRGWLVAALGADDILAVKERVEAGRVLGRLGDPRHEVLSVEAMEFCLVPAWRAASRSGGVPDMRYAFLCFRLVRLQGQPVERDAGET
jgi:hypothetical protein